MKKLFIYSIIFISLFSVSGCATSPAKMAKETTGYVLPQKSEPGSAIVYIYRSFGGGGAWKFTAFLDGKDADSEMGSTYVGQYVYFYVSPGKHVIYSGSPENWAEINIDVKEGDVVFLRQNTAAISLLSRVSLELLTEIEGKYKIKDCELGTVTRDRKKKG